jgi:hypothetical protein|eukprot:COSAG02_NODE_826_length_16718_cov_4813.219628_16_plen_89_part_00
MAVRRTDPCADAACSSPACSPDRSLWAALTPDQQVAARTLGWKDGAMWDDGLSPESGTKTWAELTSAQKTAATTLGWHRQSWEAEALQ